jgi:hypothetical protein
MNLSPFTAGAGTGSLLLGLWAEATNDPCLLKLTMLSVIVTCFVVCVHLLWDCRSKLKFKADRRAARARKKESDRAAAEPR